MTENTIEKPKKQVAIVKALIINRQGEMLFVRRNREWHKEAHGKWEFAGGKIEFGETPEQAAIREAKEETGYDVRTVRLLPLVLSATWEYEDRRSQQILFCYVCEAVSGRPDASDHGVGELRWFKRQDKEFPKEEECLPGTMEFLACYEQERKRKEP